ncbi:hypothetical protein DCAR_0417916 [Daucus carota subsp. sativus]|uniref:Uncharacterized protein n=1 Tax=Daucus carota subsp. sativus TaxID=79200 RepID=A0A165Z0P7_DAUCS|nr:hypothetical protein DCAR_0417916 [Daucus carota subsp. sativus]
MARLRAPLIFIYLVLICCITPRTESRKTFRNVMVATSVPKLDHKDPMVSSSLPKMTVPPSAPSGKTHAKNLVSRRLIGYFARIHRTMQSAPSPGVGH